VIVVWRVTERCNLACPFCAYDRTLRRPRASADPEAVAAFGAVLAEHQRATGDAVLVSWLGGEPLTWPPLRALTERFHALGLRLSTTTNGTPLASAAVRAHLLERYAELTVSVDAVGPAHDRLRGWPGGFAALRGSVAALLAERRARASGLRLRANVVLMRGNLAGFEELCGELAAWGVDEITFNQLGGNDRPEFYAANRLLPEQAAWLSATVPRMRGELAARGVRLAGGSAYLRRIRATACGVRIPVADCAPGQRFLFIDERGMVAPCSFTADDYGVPLAEIGSAEAFGALRNRFAAARQLSRAGACDDCHATQVCEKFARAPESRWETASAPRTLGRPALAVVG
jgi:radical SAM protein with 4Fe4S-binding SPASM domain